MMTLFRSVRALHDGVFSVVQWTLENWLLGLLARFTFASTLLFWFWNSAILKTFGREPQAFETFEASTLGLFIVDVDAALAQMAPIAYFSAEEPLGLPYTLMAWAGTYGEFILPTLVVLGLFTRVASVGMIVFIAVLTWVDVTGHGTVSFDLGAMFDGSPSDPIMDQRLLWLFPLVYLALRGAGAVSLDWLFARARRR